MLFSSENVSDFINRNFEPAWESVRPVPMVRVDFGNGTVVTRTLHGNIATYICLPEGHVLDIVPGVYTPTAYLERLRQGKLLAEYVALKQDGERGERVKQYHQRQADKLAQAARPDRLVERVERGQSIMAVEKSVKVVLAPAERIRTATVTDVQPQLPADELSNWNLLADDTRINESVRRRQIHEMLASVGTGRPSDLTKRLYKEVLRTDLDDPYLGLGNALFATYPFAKEESKP